MKYSLDSCCGGPKVKRVGEQVRPLTGIEKEAKLQLDAIESEYQKEFGGNKMSTMPGKRCIAKGFSPVAGLWDYDGACAPKESGYSHQMTFSVACFQWVPKSRGKGVKRAKAVKRIIGPTGNPQAVYDKAEAFCVAQEAH